METQSGARTPLVDPFGRELEEWLRDAPATRGPYLSDLVVPPVTGPVQRPDVAPPAAPAEPVSAEPAPAGPVLAEPAASADDSAFRRPRDRARHAAVCAPSFPEPPERIALRFEDLAVEVSASSGRTTIERIVILEDEVRRRDEDLARLAAWEATVAGIADPEVEAARAFAHTVFADLLADAAAEADRRERSAARRAATGPVAVPIVSAAAASAPAPALVAATEVDDAIDAPEPTTALEASTAGRDEPARVVLSLPVVSPVVSPVSANTRPTPLVQPATGPTVIDRAAFAAVLTAHVGATASTPVVLPEAATPAASTAPAVSTVPAGESAERVEQGAVEQGTGSDGWWSRLVARILQAFGRR
ncbi:hypothetical protein [Curtobacterium pusillum]|uniref:hypothetical protein n=1 Tax=Curtobacterium pusillum TaxID=69373 RepID=UPI0011A66CFB|nr:hypothetical protein [Curtobacterium pusillum]